MMRTLLGFQNLRCALSVATVAALALSAGVAPARAQGATAAPPQTGPAPQGQVLRLSMEAAVDMAMQANLGLQADRLNLDAADRRITQARAAFLPFADLSLSRTNSQSQPVANPDGTQLYSPGMARPTRSRGVARAARPPGAPRSTRSSTRSSV
jgi:outer membrane protein TolC